MKNNLTIKTLEHKGVTVHIRIDYDNGKADLVEKTIDGKWQAKKWLFKDRGLEYMNGWQDILEAMQVAVKECKKELEHDLAEKTVFTEKMAKKLLVKGIGGAIDSGAKNIKKSYIESYD